MHAPVNGTINGYKTEWIDTPKFEKGTSIDFITLNVTPQKTGAATIKLRLREENSLVFEKAFTITVGSDKKMNVKYMKGGEFSNDMPQIVSGRADLLTVKAFNSSTNLEIENAIVKIYDRFGTKLLEQLTNKLGTATIQIPASLPGEKLTLRIEKPEYETFVKEFTISQDVIKVTPESLTFTVNPQSKPQDTKTVKIENNTGMDLTIKSITLSGKLKGLLNEAQIESWFDSFVGKKIASQDFEEIDFKVISATIIPQADDIDGTFTITVGAGTKDWAKDIDAKIRVGLGKDVDNASCLEITQSNWVGTTQGSQIETSLEVKNNCIVDGKPVALTNLGATITTGESIFGTMNAQSSTVQVELGTGYARIFKTIINPGEKVPVTLKFTPYGGATGSATGSIVFEAKNKTDSKDQKLTAEMKYDLSVENIQQCIVIGSDLITLPSEGTASFSIQNTCKTSADFQIEGGELQLSNKVFTLASGASKDVTVTRNKGDIPGAYNILVYGRKAGTTLELLGNVKAILDSEGCFALSRYEYDVYDSPYNEFDGLDRGYLTNNCVQKNTGAKVSGVIPYDMSDLWKYALAGALGGYIGSGKILPDWMDSLFDERCSPSTSGIPLIGALTSNSTCGNLSALNNDIKTQLKQRLATDCSAAKATVVTDQNILKTNAGKTIEAYNKIIAEATTLSTSPQAITNASNKDCASAVGCLKETVTLAQTNKLDFNTKVNAQITRLDTTLQNIQKQCTDKQAEIEKEFAAFKAKIDQGQTLEEGKTALETYKSDRNKLIADFNKTIVEESNKTIEDVNKNVRALIGKETEANGDLDKTKTKLDGCTKDYTTNCVTVQALDKSISEKEECEQYDYADPDWISYYYPNPTECLDDEIELVELGLTTGKCCSYYVGYDLSDETPAANAPAVVQNAVTAAKANPTPKVSLVNIATAMAGIEATANECAKYADTTKGEASTYYAQQTTCPTGTIKKELPLPVAGTCCISHSVTRYYKTILSEVYYKVEVDARNVEKVYAVDLSAPQGQRTWTPKGVSAEYLINGVKNGTLKSYPTDPLLNATTGTTPAVSTSPILPPLSDKSTIGGYKVVSSKLAADGKTIEYYGANDKLLATYTGQKNAQGADLFNSYIGGSIVIIPDYTQYTPAAGSTVKYYKDSSGVLFYRVDLDPATSVQSVYYKDTRANSTTGNVWTPSPLTGAQIAADIGNGNIVSWGSTDPTVTANFILATTANSASAGYGGGGLFGGMNSGLGGLLISGFTGSMGGSALGGALIGMLTQWLQASNTTVDYSSTFTVPLVTIDETTLTSPDGIQLSVGEKIYDYDSYSGSPATTATTATTPTGTSATGTGASSGTNTAATGGNYMGNSLFNPQALSATMGQVEEYELTFTNESKATNRSMYEPFIGILTVTGTENIYATDYNYDYVKAQAKARGELKSNKKGGLSGLLQPPLTDNDSTAEIKQEDLQVKETRSYEKKFHLLFDSWEYVDCGPKTFTCPPTTLSNCDVDGKKGSTGNSALPKILLSWDYSKIDAQECDLKETTPDDYIYCDTTQFGIETLKKLVKLREFFNTTSLNQCPQAIDYVSVKTAKLSETSLDVGITSVEAKQTTTGALISATVESNNNLAMPATVTFKVSVHGGEEITNVCASQTKTLTVGTSLSGAVYTCNVDKNAVGEGTFDIDITATPELCAGCGNYNSTNDTMQTALVLGASGAVACQKYETKKDYFEKVLSANNQLSGSGAKVLEYISFKANLIRDGFSNDFKNDLDAYLMQVANVGPDYSSNGIRELFLSEKFTVEWPNKPAAWEAGKYDARLIVTFANNSWEWDNNNIESIKLTLSPQGDPEPDSPIYDVPFDGIVGMASDNGRQGYGSNYIQKTEDIFLIAKDGANNIMAQPNSSSNGIANVGVSVIKGNSAFALLNTSPTKGNVLSISRTGDDVDFVITPSVAVPLILNITRNSSTDAFAFYSAEVNGQSQETGASFISWSGIGEGCATFDGTPMKAFYNSLDSKASNNLSGYDGYGLYWPMAQLAGTASFYGSFFAPQDSETLLKITGSKDSAVFESTMGNGNVISVSRAGQAISNLQDVLDDVKAEKVCVIGGEYYWNNTGLREELISNINAKDNSCISAR
ncbi:MAG: hypothetical protein WCW44_02105 [archaeon]